MQLSKHHHKSEFLYSMSGQVLRIVGQHSYLGVIGPCIFPPSAQTIYKTKHITVRRAKRAAQNFT